MGDLLVGAIEYNWSRESWYMICEATGISQLTGKPLYSRSMWLDEWVGDKYPSAYDMMKAAMEHNRKEIETLLKRELESHSVRDVELDDTEMIEEMASDAFIHNDPPKYEVLKGEPWYKFSFDELERITAARKRADAEMERLILSTGPITTNYWKDTTQSVPSFMVNTMGSQVIKAILNQS